MRNSNRSHSSRPWVALVLIVLGALALGACGRKPLPPLSAIADAPLLRPGSSWTYKVEDSSLPQPVTLTLTFDKEDVYKGTSVLSFTAGSEIRAGRLPRADGRGRKRRRRQLHAGWQRR